MRSCPEDDTIFFAIGCTSSDVDYYRIVGYLAIRGSPSFDAALVLVHRGGFNFLRIHQAQADLLRRRKELFHRSTRSVLLITARNHESESHKREDCLQDNENKISRHQNHRYGINDSAHKDKPTV